MHQCVPWLLILVDIPLLGVELESLMEEKDLGVYVDHNFKVGKQCTKAAAIGNQILGLISRAFVTRNKDVMMTLYKSLQDPIWNIVCKHGGRT